MLVFSELKSAPSAFAPLSHVSLCVCVEFGFIYLIFIFFISNTQHNIYTKTI